MLKLALAVTMAFSSYAMANEKEVQPEIVSFPLTGAYIPGGFDSNDRAQVVVEGYLPNTCYRVGPIEYNVNQVSNEISIHQYAYKYNGPCLMMIVPFTQTVAVGILNAKTYNVKDTDNGDSLGRLSVQVANNSGPDDYLYASVSEAYVGIVDGNKKAIIVQGELPGDCWALKETRVVLDGKNVIAVLPIIEKTRENKCNDYRIPFVKTIDIPAVKPGRYLLHVRSLNGLAVNKLVDL